MRLATPRIPPVDLDDLTPEQHELLWRRAGYAGQEQPLNVLRTIAQAPKALKRYGLWSDYVLGSYNSLSPRLREIVILRTGWLCGSGYEWTQHSVVGRECGLSDAEIERIKLGADAPEWSAIDAAALRATDELVADHFISDATWAALAELGDRGRADLIYSCGTYVMVSMFLNSAGVQLDPGQTLDPAFDAAAAR